MKILSTYGKVVNGMEGYRNWCPVHIQILLPYQVLLLPCHFQVAPFLCLCFFNCINYSMIKSMMIISEKFKLLFYIAKVY